MDADQLTLIAVAGGGVVVAAIVLTIVLIAVTRNRLPPGAMRDPVACWQMADPALRALGLSRLDAECYTIELGSIRQTLYVKLEPASRSLRAWLKRIAQGGAVEAFLGASATVGPGDGATSGLRGLVAGAVRETFATLPRAARLTVKAPQIPGDEYNLDLTTPFHLPDQAAASVRTILALDRALQQPPPAGWQPAQLPPVVHAWQAAEPALKALGLQKLDAETYTTGVLGQSLFVTFHPRESRVRVWIEKACPGGAIEQFIGTRGSLGPGDSGRAPIERFVAGAVREILTMLPRGAQLEIVGPEIPGDKYKASVGTSFSVPDHAVLAARVLLALDAAATGAGTGAPAAIPPIAMLWREAGGGLQSLGLHPISAEGWARDLDGSLHTLYVSLEVRAAEVQGWLRGSAPGGVIDRCVGQQGELRPGAAGRSQLEVYVAGAVAQGLASLPRAARLSMQGPEIPGGEYKLRLTTPFTAPHHAAIVAQVLLAADGAVRRG